MKEVNIMPLFDRTGPSGQGPLTGRGMGLCGGGFGGRFGFGRGSRFGRGFGRGLGLGRGFGFFGRAPTESEEKELLKDYRKDLEQELSAVDKELNK